MNDEILNAAREEFLEGAQPLAARADGAFD